RQRSQCAANADTKGPRPKSATCMSASAPDRLGGRTRYRCPRGALGVEGGGPGLAGTPREESAAGDPADEQVQERVRHREEVAHRERARRADLSLRRLHRDLDV